MSAQKSRRQFLGVALGAAASLSGLSMPAAGPRRRLRVAAVFTEFTYRSHAHVILENFLEPYLFNGKRTDPGVEVVSFYADQRPQGDMTQDVARAYKIPIFRTIGEALCLGGKQLAVDAVLSIAEFGRYPTNELGQTEYPRKRFFDETVAVMRRSRRFVPLYNDKHLSYRWDWAKEMVDTARNLGIPFMAGSSVPLAQRIPPFDLPAGVPIAEAVSIHGGGVESYDFHALQVLQSIVEFRRGGETGISSVEFLKGDALWKAAKEGRWSLPLAEKAMEMELGKKPTTLKQVGGEKETEPYCILLTYKDGLRGCVLKVGQSGIRWNFACRLKGDPQPHATRFYVGPWQNRNLFKALSHAIQHHFRTGIAPYPVERTLLSSGVLDASMHSRAQAGELLKTPHLEFAYAARDFTSMREMGGSWKIVTEAAPEPRGIDHTVRNQP
ncbi:MAG TPA: hypothetical protein VK395_15200 [Gemmataceae bacterium]|nr:hypothetical protein [Gemmataceae bacterium]